jgi:type I restriction enzyme M protein
VSDAFKERRTELEQQFRDPNHDYYLGDESMIPEELEARDYYTEKNVFWVPALARWDFIQANAKVAVGTKLSVKNGKASEYEFKGIGRLLDDALDAVEKDNPKLKNILVKDYARLQVDSVLPSLIDLIAGIPFHHESLNAKDILGHVYEYFLGEFAMAEGKKGGQYYTPKSIVTVIVEMLQPFKGRVYDPCCGSGGFFVQSEKFIQEHGGRIGQISVYGQESKRVKIQGDYEIPVHFAILPEHDDPQETQKKESRLLGLNIYPIWYPVGHHECVEKLARLIIAVAENRTTLGM